MLLLLLHKKYSSSFAGLGSCMGSNLFFRFVTTRLLCLVDSIPLVCWLYMCTCVCVSLYVHVKMCRVATVPEFVARVFMFFKASMGPGVHTCHSDVRSLTFVEEYWRLPPQPSDPLCSEIGCVRLYSTTPKVHYVIDTWRILGPAPVIRNAVHPTIPHGALPRTQAQR